MKLAEQRVRLRKNFLDDTSDNPDQNDSDYRWKDTELDSTLADAQDEACRRAKLIWDEDSTDGEISLSAGTYLYDVSTKFTHVDEFIFDGKSLVRTDFPSLMRHSRGWRGATSSTPKWYAINGRKLAVYPPPDATEAAKTARVAGYRLPINRLSNGNPTPEIPEPLHQHLVYYAAKLLYQKRDIDTYDPAKASDMEQEFSRYFGPLLRADAMASQFEAGENIVIMVE